MNSCSVFAGTEALIAQSSAFAGGLADRHEILDRVVRNLRVDRNVDGDRAGVAEHDRVAVARVAWQRTRARSSPAAPPLLSITTGWPSTSCIFGCSVRATKSRLPPGGNGTTNLIGRFG
jgi:hypothetical protein